MLDVSIRAEILQLLDRLVRERSIAMLYITHDLLSARLLADEIIVLNKGQIVERGNAKQVITQPAGRLHPTAAPLHPEPVQHDGNGGGLSERSFADFERRLAHAERDPSLRSG